jgi:drug/metabolite transporter (DMT)-like permease
MRTWIYLSDSGIMGFVLGDYFLFTGYKLIGSRRSMLFMSLSPVLIIPASMVVWKRKVRFRGIRGALIAFGGITLWFL